MEYMKSLPDKYFSLVIADPPYGISVPKGNFLDGMGGRKDSAVQKIRKSRISEGAGKLKNRTIQMLSSDWDLNPPTQEYFDEIFRISKNQLIFGGNYFNLPPTRCVVCWDKEQHWPNFSQIELAWTSFDKPAKLFRYPTSGSSPDKSAKIHATQKPIALYSFILNEFAKHGDTIFDPYLGSGSSRIAAFKAGYDFVGCEIDPVFFASQEKRFREVCHGETELKSGKTLKQLSIF